MPARFVTAVHKQGDLPIGLIDKVRSVLNEAFPGDQVKLMDNDGISGYVVSERFEGEDMIDRINMIWDVLDRGLSLDERRDVLMIAPATPDEAVAYSA